MKHLFLATFILFSSSWTMAESLESNSELILGEVTFETKVEELAPFCVPSPSECVYSCPQKSVRWELDKKLCTDSLLPVACYCLLD